MSSACRARRVKRAETVELDVLSLSSESSSSCQVVLFDKLDIAKMHGLDTSNVSSRVVSWRAKWNLALSKDAIEMLFLVFLALRETD